MFLQNRSPWLCVVWSLVFLMGHQLIHITKHFDYAFAPSELSRWMDTYNGHIGGWFHRLKHGHDLICSLPSVYKNFGLLGLIRFPWELLQDFTTPHGLPIPGVQCLIVDHGFLRIRFVQDWLSINIVQLLLTWIAQRINRSTIHQHPILFWAQFSAALYNNNLLLLLQTIKIPIKTNS